MEDMTWNFRLVDMTAVNDGEPWIEIKEVYYEGEKPAGYASEPLAVRVPPISKRICCGC